MPQRLVGATGACGEGEVAAVDEAAVDTWEETAAGGERDATAADGVSEAADRVRASVAHIEKLLETDPIGFDALGGTST